MKNANLRGGLYARKIQSGHRRALACATALALTGLAVPITRATTSNAVWTNGGGNNLWSNAANWSPSGVPNNGTNGFTDYNVSIGSPSPTYEDISPTIDSLTISASGQLIINPNQIFTVSGPTVTDNGSIQIDNGNGNAAFNFSGNTTISGTGTIVLDDSNPLARLTSKAGVTVTQSAGHTISGTGEVDASLINNGTVNANSYGHQLVLQTNNMSNNSLFEATGNGTLSIIGITLTQGTNGQIVANGGTVGISGASISGGTLNGSNGAFTLTSSTLTNVTVASGGTVYLTAGTTVNVAGTTLTNNGTIQVDTNSANADLNFTSNVTVGGTGSIYLFDNSPHPTLNTSNGATVTFSSGQTVGGEGIINAQLVNNGTIDAYQYGQALTLQTNSMVNNNIFEATGNGTLNISGITVSQGTNGVIELNGGYVNISGSNISGGTLTTPVGSYIGVSDSTFSNVNISTGTTIIVVPDTTLHVAGSLNNNGTIQVDNNNGAANLNFNNTMTITGTGGIYLYDSNPHPTLNTSAGATVTLSAGQTVYGDGIVNASLINQGVINANVYGQSLTLATNAMTNNNLFESSGNGTLIISGITVTQGTGGQILVGNNSTVSITGSNISGGTLNASNGSPMYITSSTLSGVTIFNASSIILTASTLVNVIGPLTNNGTIQVDQNSGNAVLNFLTSTTVGGIGTITLDDNNPHPSINTSSGAVLTLSAGQTINGEGNVNAALVNNGVINANIYGQSLNLQTNSETNNNLLESSGNGTLNIIGITVTQAAGAQIVSGVNSTVSISSSNISGGYLNSSSGSTIYLTSSNLSNVAITNGSSVVLTPGTTVNIIGSLVNNGTIQVDQNSSNANLNFLNNVAVSGTGTIFLDDNNPSPTINTSSGATVTIGSGQLIDGEGIINASLINNGTINANIYGQSLTLATNTMVNNNLIEATGNGTLGINGILINNSGGTISNVVGGLSIFNGANISGGTLTSAAGYSIGISGATFTNVNISTGTNVVIQSGQLLTIVGSLNNNGTIQVDVNSANADLNFVGSSAVSGTGSIVLDDHNPNARLSSSPGATPTLGTGQTVSGVGEIDGTFINNGLIDANAYGQNLSINGSISGAGSFKAENNGTLNIVGSVTVNAGGLLVGVNGAAGYIVVNQGAQLTDSGSETAFPTVINNGVLLFTANPNSGFKTHSLGSLSLGSTGVATVAAASATANRTLLITQSLNFAGSTNAWTGLLNLTNNDLDVSGGSLSTVNNQLQEGLNNGGWNGPGGIVSSIASANTTHLTALGAIQNNQSGTALFTASHPFDGATPGAGDILVKYTYFGDANLDGKVDGSDYSRIDAAFTANKTNPNSYNGWLNGDFNYDGVINGSDYTLIDNSFNRETALYTNQIATATAQIALSANGAAVPEPTAIGLLSFAALTSLRRRKR